MAESQRPSLNRAPASAYPPGRAEQPLWIHRALPLLTAIALFLDGLAFTDFLLHPLAGDFAYHSPLFRALSILLLAPLSILVGFLIIRRVPGNPVGPLLVMWSATVAFGSLRLEIGVLLFSLFAFYEVAIGWSSLNFMLLFFPDGRFYPPLAHWLSRLFWITILLGSLIHLSHAANYIKPNPLFIPALAKFENLILVAMMIPGMFTLSMVVLTLVLRYRQGNRLQRQQIKWLALLGSLLAAGTVLVGIVFPLITGGMMFSREDNLFSVVFFFTMGLFPALAIGISVLRYRLWDIDIIIRRTLQYSSLTVILMFIYLSGVLLLQEFFQLFTGEHQSPIATVISTLLIVGLFNPLRRRLQDTIDRRFYRQRYDAEQTLQDFATTLREEVDLDQLQRHLVSVVQETMHPDRLGLWMKPRGDGGREKGVR